MTRSGSALVLAALLAAAPSRAHAEPEETVLPTPGSAERPLFLDEDLDWPAGVVQHQLDADPTLVPYGKGALFIPAMTNPLDEPPVVVRQGGRIVAEGTSGQRFILTPGTYTVQLGSGAVDQRMVYQATVREQHTTVIPASWAGLTVHVVDERYASLRSSYELIRMEDREYIGIGFGTDEQAGEPVSTWILRPGLYKIVRLGDTYRARRDFSTVRLVEGRYTHFLLVLNEDTGEFIGGGEVTADELFRPQKGLVGRMVLGGDVAMNARSNVLGFADGLGFAFRGFVDARASVPLGDHPLILRTQIEQGQTKAPHLPWQKTNDRADLDALYVFRVLPWLGPYARFGAETNLLPGFQAFDQPVSAVFLDGAGNELERLEGVTRLDLSPPFGLTTLKEGAGMNLRVLKSIFAEATVRTGVGARHRLARDLFAFVGDNGPGQRLTLRRVDSTHQVGVEATVLGIARLTRWVVANIELDTLVPFDDVSNVVLELEGSVALKLTTYLSVNYVVRYLRDKALTERDRLQQDVLLRFSLEIF